MKVLSGVPSEFRRRSVRGTARALAGPRPTDVREPDLEELPRISRRDGLLLRPREAEAVRLLARLRFLTAPVLCEFLFGRPPVVDGSALVMTRRLLRALARRKLVAKSVRTAAGRGGGVAPFYYLTPTGDRLAATLSGLRRPRLRSEGVLMAAHALALAGVILAFAREARRHAGHDLVTWECEWETPQPLARAGVVPDAYLLYRMGERRLHAFVEVDTGSEHNRVIVDKIRRYLELERAGTWRTVLPVWPYVLFVATTRARAANIRRLAELACIHPAGTWRPGADAFHIAALEDACGDAFAPVWRTVATTEPTSLLSAPAPRPDPHAARSE